MALDRKTGALVALLALNVPVQAAYIGASKDRAEHRVILIEGEIVEGDQYLFEEVWAAHPDTEAVDLDSPGGLILPALHIGETIRRGGLATMVPRNSTCASACADIWLAGIHRILPEGARLGFHGIYGKDGKTLTMTGAGNGLVGAYMARLGYSDSAVIFATGAQPNEIAWLDPHNPFNMHGITFEASPPKQLRVSEVWVDDQMKAVEVPPPPLAPKPQPKPPELPKHSEVNHHCAPRPALNHKTSCGSRPTQLISGLDRLLRFDPVPHRPSSSPLTEAQIVTTLRTSPDALILRLLLDRPHAAAVAIGTACRMMPGEVRSRLAHLESLRLITGRQDKGTPPSRVYLITSEGRRKVES